MRGGGVECSALGESNLNSISKILKFKFNSLFIDIVGLVVMTFVCV